MNMMDDLTKIFISIVAMVVAYVLAQGVVRLRAFDYLSSRRGRFGAVDGLRGYLALFAFIHHFVLTWYWRNTGDWNYLPESYFNNIGYVGVHIFFMITGFLFVSKLLRDSGNTNWFRLYKSRIFRIYPLYLVALVVISFIVFYQSSFQVNVEPLKIIKQYVKWFIYHGSTINDFGNTTQINAGVHWTLKYEWVFYLSLPFIAAVMARGSVAVVVLLLSVWVLFFYPQQIVSISTFYFLLFAVGGLTAYFSLLELPFAERMKSAGWSVAAILGLLAGIFYPDSQSLVHVLSISLFFVPVALGNDMFGLFMNRASILLGEISYSIYLLHGIVLYVLFSLVLSQYPVNTSLFDFLYVMPLVSLLVIITSTLTFLMIEKPCINYGRK